MIVIGFLKRNVVNIVAGVVALASIGLGVWGYLSMGAVTEEMNGIASMYGQFETASRKAVNDAVIDAEKKRVQTVQRFFEELINKAAEYDRYEPLTPPEGERFFPEPTDNGRRAFPTIYRNALIAFQEALHAGLPPDDSDIRNAQEAIDEEKRLASTFVDEPDGRTTEADGDEEPNKSGLISAKEAAESAAARAAIQRARMIYCYIGPQTFDERQFQGLSPRPSEMWFAQLSLWVQQDVVAAIARINNRAAQELVRDDPNMKPWVGVMPIKDVISIRVSNYIPTDERPEVFVVEGDKPVAPRADYELTFTRNKSNDLYEVVQFAVKLVVDARDLPMIIDEICKNRFHTLLNIQYVYDRSMLENLSMEGRIYGSEPAVVVVMEFETIFLGDLYRCMMPKSVLAKLGKECKQDKSS